MPALRERAMYDPATATCLRIGGIKGDRALQPYSELFKAGELVFAEGDAPTGAYLIESGRI
jgi:hypothetical protein